MDKETVRQWTCLTASAKITRQRFEGKKGREKEVEEKKRIRGKRIEERKCDREEEIDKERNRETDRQTDRQTGRQAGRQRERIRGGNIICTRIKAKHVIRINWKVNKCVG